jgi:integrase
MSVQNPRPPKGEVLRRQVRGGVIFALRFTAYGKRQYVTLGRPDDGWSEARAEQELDHVLSDVLRGIWKPARREPVPEVAPDPTFHEFSSEWFEATRGEWRDSTRLDYEWQLRVHLLDFFKGHRLSEITVAEVDRYRESKVSEKILGATSINKTITRLGQILEVAVERELIARNPAKVGGKRRKLKPVKPSRTYLDRAEQIEALLKAAGQLDVEAKSNGQIARRAMLATMTFAGLRISELIALDWRDVDLAAGRIRVRQSKTDAGIRYVDLLPVLRDELDGLKAARNPNPDDPVFASAVGTRLDRNRVLKRVLGRPARVVKGEKVPGTGAVGLANKQLEAEGLTALPDGLTLHALRRTFGSLLIAIGRDPAYVMGQMGHTDPTVTLGLYAKVMSVGEGDRERLRALVGGDYLALAGTGGDLADVTAPSEAEGNA